MTIEKNPDYPILHLGPRLYILARTDIYQMNPGKLAAQAAHAATQFVFDVLDSNDKELITSLHEWRAQGGGGFGTKITLAATQDQIQETVLWMQAQGFASDVVIDPTYPFTNHYGEFFTAREMTCGYVFAPANTPAPPLEYLRQFNLHQ